MDFFSIWLWKLVILKKLISWFKILLFGEKNLFSAQNGDFQNFNDGRLFLHIKWDYWTEFQILKMKIVSKYLRQVLFKITLFSVFSPLCEDIRWSCSWGTLVSATLLFRGSSSVVASVTTTWRSRSFCFLSAKNFFSRDNRCSFCGVKKVNIKNSISFHHSHSLCLLYIVLST